jgi:dethiobiotin synthetase
LKNKNLLAMAKGFFITGTDTGIGKTTATLQLMKATMATGLKVAAMKPVASGCTSTTLGLRNDDAITLSNESNLSFDYDTVNPYAFEPPIAPHIAADLNDISIVQQPILDCYQQMAQQADVVFVEGIGGWQVPINQTQTMADVAVALNLPVILVVGIQLGCLNHSLLTYQSMVTSQLPFAGWIANHLAAYTEGAKEMVTYLKNQFNQPLLAQIPYAENQMPSCDIDIKSLLRNKNF